MATPDEIRRRGRLSLIFGTVLAAVAFAAVAYADDITNDLPGTVKVMALNVGGGTGSTHLAVVPRNGDGKQGCNLTGAASLGVSLSSSAPSVATVSPTSLTFTSCGDVKTVTVTPHDQGSANVTLRETSNTTSGSFNLAPAAFRVDVAAPPNRAPNVSVTGVGHGASYAKGSVPVAGCAVDDAEDGDSTFAASLSAITGAYASDALGTQTATCSYTDGGGLTETVSATYSIYDSSAPNIDFDISGTLGDNGWYVGDVGLVWTVTENDSPHSLSKSGCDDHYVTADQSAIDYLCSAASAGGSTGPMTVSIKRDASAPTIDCGTLPSGWQAQNVVVNCTASDVGPAGLAGDASFQLATNVADDTEDAGASAGSKTIADNAGNEASVGPLTFQVDRKDPIISCDSPDGAWHAADVSISCTAHDGGSGVSPSADESFSLTTHVPSGTETADAWTGTKSVSDAVGNAAPAGPIGGNKVDKKAPSVALTCPSGAVLKGSSASASWSASDSGSGLVTPGNGSIELDTSSVGPQTASLPAGFAADAVDNDSAVTSCSYAVVYDWTGFFQPIDNKDGSGNYITNKARAGSTIPVKFGLGGDQGLAILVSGYPQSAPIPCTPSSGDAVEEYSTATVSGLKYDPAAGRYIYNWKSNAAWAGTCRQLVVKLDDGTYHRANFNFFK